MEHGARNLVVVGGEGVVLEAVDEIIRWSVNTSEVKLGIIASGRGNDVVRALGLPCDDVAKVLGVIPEWRGCGGPG